MRDVDAWRWFRAFWRMGCGVGVHVDVVSRGRCWKFRGLDGMCVAEEEHFWGNCFSLVNARGELFLRMVYGVMTIICSVNGSVFCVRPNSMGFLSFVVVALAT
ncbi:hypothetical protein M758_2G078600 [Ceratodon purpureus]|nr:hypothetical protein M758_2G078600 [Ceratodon purpureus]